jgi:hypothetical protein
MAADDLMQIRITADFKEAEGAFLKMAKVATAFETDFRRISSGLNKEFNKINGMAELFGNSTNVVKDKMDALKRSMEQLMTLGLQPMNPQVQKLKAQYDALAASIVHTTQETTKVSKATKQAGDSVKKSNMQWTNWALVLQDLPYGFRGIQNNLPALMGGIAGMAGPLYLVGSAIIALFTAWDQGSFKAEQAIDRVAEAHKRNTEVLTKGAEAEAEALVEMRKMSVIFDGVRDGTITAEAALKTYNETYGETWGIAKGVNEAEDSFIKKSSMYVKATALRAMANEKYAQAQEAFKTGRLAAGEDQTSFLTKFAAGMDALDQVGIMGLDGVSLTKFAKAFTKNYAESQKVLVNDIKNLSASSFDALMAQGADLEKEANKMLSDAGIKPTGKGKKGGAGAAVKDNFALDSLRAKQKAYKDDIYLFRDYGNLIINEEERIAVARAMADGTYEKNKKDLRERYQSDRIANDKLFEEKLNTILDENAKKRIAAEEKEFKRNQDSIKANIDFETKIYRDSNRIWDQIQKEKSDAQVKYTRDYINKLNEQLRVELKLHKNNVLLQQEDVKNKIDQLKFLQFFAAGNVAATELINSAIMKLTGTMAGFGKISAVISTVLGDTLQSAFEGIGETIGQLIATGKFDFSILGNILADALIQIGKALIMYSALVKAAKEALEKGKFKAGLVVGVLAIAAGVALKASLNKKKDSGVQAFANGGVISGPTMGLMGEYPGARSNPEIVAPLDKLKGLIGGNNGGTLEARISGNDLLILMNKAQRNNNLSF